MEKWEFNMTARENVTYILDKDGIPRKAEPVEDVKPVPAEKVKEEG
jgi:hypothetical protein